MYEIRFPVFIDPNAVNLIIAAVIAFLVIYWMKICFIRPPRFSKFTAPRFFHQSFLYVSNGSRDELLVLAQELMHEIPRLVSNSPDRKRSSFMGELPVVSKLEAHAANLLLLLSDPRFCDVVAEEIPTFPAYLAEQMVALRRPDAPAHLVIRRVVISLLAKPQSALFVENEWLEQGFAGEVKPITRSIFRNWHKLEQFEGGIESPLDLDYPHARTWDAETWTVYFGMAKEYVRGLTSSEFRNSDANGLSYVLRTTERAYERIGDVEKYENVFDPHNPRWHASEANKFLTDIIKIFDESGEHVYFSKKDRYYFGSDLSSKLAKLLYEAIFHASSVNTKDFTMWDVQHNIVWSPISRFEIRDTKIMKMVRRKLRRMIWDEISRMDGFPNYKGARFVRFCLNVLGFYDEKIHRRDGLERDSWILAKVVSSWVANNYQTIASSHPPVAEAMLPANIEYDPVREVLIRSRDDSLTGVSRVKEFSLEPSRASADLTALNG
ncbi:hypothetical protein SAMN05444340_111108 [Citreimonas salinaria]|uniref:Uncharacterized protein n=2 Tax=Citreimonas salinaria TaxID=321339 RepID=A0A1H3L672_9RHOB|nr:hypothetical protein SAMN05444340_111108 [Citreimonas salinaria]